MVGFIRSPLQIINLYVNLRNPTILLILCIFVSPDKLDPVRTVTRLCDSNKGTIASLSEIYLFYFILLFSFIFFLLLKNVKLGD
jgi:hypothetical protein